MNRRLKNIKEQQEEKHNETIEDMRQEMKLVAT